MKRIYIGYGMRGEAQLYPFKIIYASSKEKAKILLKIYYDERKIKYDDLVVQEPLM